MLKSAAEEIERLRAAISRLEAENARLKSMPTTSESVRAVVYGEKIDQLQAAISRLREYARHKPSCCWWRGPSCDCGYDELMAELEETK